MISVCLMWHVAFAQGHFYAYTYHSLYFCVGYVSFRVSLSLVHNSPSYGALFFTNKVLVNASLKRKHYIWSGGNAARM